MIDTIKTLGFEVYAQLRCSGIVKKGDFPALINKLWEYSELKKNDKNIVKYDVEILFSLYTRLSNEIYMYIKPETDSELGKYFIAFELLIEKIFSPSSIFINDL